MPGCTGSDFCWLGACVHLAAISSGGDHVCALTSLGGVQCWGDNSHGQLGNGSTNASFVPTPVTGLSSGVAAISSGGSHTCAVTTSGTLLCWGDNQSGQIGDASFTERHMPTQVFGLSSGVAAVAASGAHTCALSSTGSVRCWGDGIEGELGDGHQFSTNFPDQTPAMTSGASGVSGGGTDSCALTAVGGLECWGANYFGELGTQSPNPTLTPAPVVGLSSGVAYVSNGDHHSCAATTAGEVFCWGSNEYGQLGTASWMDVMTPQPVPGLSAGWITVSVGIVQSCALNAQGSVECWGSNMKGDLGNGSTADSKTPIVVPALSSGVGALSVADHHACVLTTAGRAKCWGWNLYGELGDGTQTERGVPVDVIEP